MKKINKDYIECIGVLLIGLVMIGMMFGLNIVNQYLHQFYLNLFN